MKTVYVIFPKFIISPIFVETNLNTEINVQGENKM